MKRIQKKFDTLKKQKNSAFVAYICAGNPSYETSLEVLKSMPKVGVDIIEIGVPFLDPSGDGPTIENASRLSIAGGMNLQKTLQMVAEFRKDDITTPIILMGYYNPILKFGLNKIFVEAEKSGVDGMLIVDLPPEEEDEILPQIKKTKLDLIRLIAPTTSKERAQKIMKNASGFLYLISMLGITGSESKNASQDKAKNKENLKMLRGISDLPIVIGFGIQNQNQAKDFATIGADGVVVGSAIVKEMVEEKSKGDARSDIVKKVTQKISEFSATIHSVLR